MDFYDIDLIVKEALRSGTDISPTDRQDWKMFCCALKTLGYDESTFVALSSGRECDSRRAWRSERNPRRYRNEHQAKGMIVNLAKQAGMELRNFRLSSNDSRASASLRRSSTNRRPAMPVRAVDSREAAKIEYVPKATVDQMAQRFRETSLYGYLCRWFDSEDVDKVFALYNVGASKYVNIRQGGRATSFPYIDAEGRCVDCKIFHIDPTTGSRKSAPPLKEWTDKNGSPCQLPTTWALAEQKKSQSRAPWCNFGDHLLGARPSDRIGIVESEKSCLILSLAYPERLWIALGSMQNLTPERLKPYAGRKLTLCPDRDGYELWSRKASELPGNYAISLDTTITQCAGKPTDDLADIVMRAIEKSTAINAPHGS